MATDGSAMDRLFEEQNKNEWMNEWMKENWWIGLVHAKGVNYSIGLFFPENLQYN